MRTRAKGAHMRTFAIPPCFFQSRSRDDCHHGWDTRDGTLRAPSRPGSITGAPVAAYSVPPPRRFTAAAHEGASGRRDTGLHQPPALCARAAPYYPRSMPSLCSVVSLTLPHTPASPQAAPARACAGSPSTLGVFHVGLSWGVVIALTNMRQGLPPA